MGMAPKVSLCCVRCERSDGAGDDSVALELGELGGKDETCSESPKHIFGVSGKGGVAGWVLGVLGGLWGGMRGDCGGEDGGESSLESEPGKVEKRGGSMFSPSPT